MPRRPAKLANCYVPLPLPQTEEIQSKTTTTRVDGRVATHELRQLCLETSVVSKAMGSALVELGHTKILCEVHLAAANTMLKQKSQTNEATTDTGSLHCQVKYAPHIGINQISQQSSSVTQLDGSSNNSSSTTTMPTVSDGKLRQELLTRENDLSKRLTAALLPVMVLDEYPKCSIVVCVTVLQDDGACLSACITAASMALVDARVHIRDMVTSCTVAVVQNTDDDEDDEDEDRFIYLADPTQQESTNTSLICLAMTPNHKEVTLWSQSGRLSSEMAAQAMELCRDGCRTMHKFMRESWMEQ